MLYPNRAYTIDGTRILNYNRHIINPPRNEQFSLNDVFCVRFILGNHREIIPKRGPAIKIK